MFKYELQSNDKRHQASCNLLPWDAQLGACAMCSQKVLLWRRHNCHKCQADKSTTGCADPETRLGSHLKKDVGSGKTSLEAVQTMSASQITLACVSPCCSTCCMTLFRKVRLADKRRVIPSTCTHDSCAYGNSKPMLLLAGSTEWIMYLQLCYGTLHLRNML